MWSEVVKSRLCPAFGMCSEDVRAKRILMWEGKQPVDGARPYSTGAQTDKLPAQCWVCFLRAAGGNVSRGPWLGEAGCPRFLRSSLALGAVFSVLYITSSPRGIGDTLSPQDFWPAPIQEAAKLLMCRQNRL